MIKIKRTLTAPILAMVCYLILTLTSYIDPKELSSNDNIYLSVIILQLLIFLIPGIIYCKLRGKKTTENVRIKPLSVRKVFFCVFAFFVLLAGAALIKLALYQLGYFSTSYTLYENFIPSDTGSIDSIIYILLALAVLPAITEEFVFRGIILQEYREAGCSNVAALMISSLLFAIMHFNLAQFPVYFFGGVVLGLVYMVTDSIIASILVHFLNNAFSMFFETSIFRLMSQSDSVIFVMFIFAVVFLTFLVLSLHEAERIIYDRGINGEQPPFPVPKRKRKKDRTVFSDRLLEALISPTFLLCVAAFFVITFGVK